MGMRGQTTKYPVLVKVRISEAHQFNLATLAAARGESLSAAIRRLITDATDGGRK